VDEVHGGAAEVGCEVSEATQLGLLRTPVVRRAPVIDQATQEGGARTGVPVRRFNRREAIECWLASRGDLQRRLGNPDIKALD